jgi:hypothetical protein
MGKRQNEISSLSFRFCPTEGNNDVLPELLGQKKYVKISGGKSKMCKNQCGKNKISLIRNFF